MKFTNILILLLVNTFSLTANNPAKEARQSYIDQFSSIAMFEMQRSGVPASIILAQGIIESNSGNSQLALDSKNHFGIKCKEWNGRTVYYEDDDYKNGKLVKSCFRAYDDVLDSYADHSDFLRTGDRYLWLFTLAPTDYEGWARGLKKSGYATNPKYAEILISIIEEYHLDIYDTPKTNVLTTQPDNNGIGQMANDMILETPKYQLNEGVKQEPTRRKKLWLKLATTQVQAADRPMLHGVNAR